MQRLIKNVLECFFLLLIAYGVFHIGGWSFVSDLAVSARQQYILSMNGGLVTNDLIVYADAFLLTFNSTWSGVIRTSTDMIDNAIIGWFLLGLSVAISITAIKALFNTGDEAKKD